MNKRGVMELPWVFSLGSIYRYEVDEILGDAHIVEGAYLNERPDWPTAPTLFFSGSTLLWFSLSILFFFVFYYCVPCVGVLGEKSHGDMYRALTWVYSI